MSLAGTTKNIMRSLYNDDIVSARTIHSVYNLICLVFGPPVGNKFYSFFEVYEMDGGDDEYRPDRTKKNEFAEWVDGLR